MEILENFPKIILAFATCGVKKYRPHHAVSLLQFSENLKKAIKKLNGNEQKKKKNENNYLVIQDYHYYVWN